MVYVKRVWIYIYKKTNFLHFNLYRCKYNNGSIVPLIEVRRTSFRPHPPTPPTPAKDPHHGTILDDDLIDNINDDPDFDVDTYDSSSESDDTYYGDDTSSSSSDEDEGELYEKVFEGNVKGSRTDGGSGNQDSASSNSSNNNKNNSKSKSRRINNRNNSRDNNRSSSKNNNKNSSSSNRKQVKDKAEPDADLRPDENLYGGKGTRADAGQGENDGEKISYDGYPGVPEQAVTRPVVAAVFTTAGLFLLAWVNSAFFYFCIFYYFAFYSYSTYAGGNDNGKTSDNIVEMRETGTVLSAGAIGWHRKRGDALRGR